METQRVPSNDSDPDIFGAVTLVVATVSMFAQLASLRLQGQQQQVPRDLSNDPQALYAFDKLRGSIQTAIQHVETSIRLLSRAQSDDVEPLRANFRFGGSRTSFDPSTFTGYQELVGQIASDAGQVSSWTLQMIRHHPGVAEGLANKLIAEVTNVQDRINRLFSGHRTNESVLDECLVMLRSFNGMLGRLESSRN